MVTEYGMSSLGPMQYEHRSESVFLGRDYNKTKDFSDQVALQIDQEVKKIIDSCYSKAKDIVSKEKKLIEILLQLGCYNDIIAIKRIMNNQKLSQTKIRRLANNKDIYIAGGASIYKDILENNIIVDNYYITVINQVVIGGDKFFPNFDKSLYDKTILEKTPEYTRYHYKKKVK